MCKKYIETNHQLRPGYLFNVKTMCNFFNIGNNVRRVRDILNVWEGVGLISKCTLALTTFRWNGIRHVIDQFDVGNTEALYNSIKNGQLKHLSFQVAKHLVSIYPNTPNIRDLAVKYNSHRRIYDVMSVLYGTGLIWASSHSKQLKLIRWNVPVDDWNYEPVDSSLSLTLPEITPPKSLTKKYKSIVCTRSMNISTLSEFDTFDSSNTMDAIIDNDDEQEQHISLNISADDLPLIHVDRVQLGVSIHQIIDGHNVFIYK